MALSHSRFDGVKSQSFDRTNGDERESTRSAGTSNPANRLPSGLLPDQTAEKSFNSGVHLLAAMSDRWVECPPQVSTRPNGERYSTFRPGNADRSPR